MLSQGSTAGQQQQKQAHFSQASQQAATGTYPSAQVPYPQQPIGAVAASKLIMHPVVPQPGSQTTVPTSSYQAPAMSSASNEPGNSTTLPKTDKISNIDLLAGLDIAAGSVASSVCIKDTPLALTVPEHKDSAKETTSITAPKQDKLRETEKFTPSTEQLKQESDRLQGIVAGLTQKTLQGTVPLDTYWKDVLDSVEKSGKKLSVSVARCYPMKNRASDILPYDQSRVELKLLKEKVILCISVTK